MLRMATFGPKTDLMQLRACRWLTLRRWARHQLMRIQAPLPWY